MSIHPKFNWTDEHLAQMKTMAAEGMSSRDIAEAIGGLTRCAVIGKARRAGIDLKLKPTGNGKGNGGGWRKPKAKKAAPVPAKTTVEPKPVTLKPVRAPFHPTAGNPTPFAETTAFQCRAILPDQDNVPGYAQFVCGNPFKPDAREWYCEACAKVMHGPGTPAERKAVPASLVERKRAVTTPANQIQAYG